MSLPKYSRKYIDDLYEYRNVVISIAKIEMIPHRTLLNEDQWRSLGINQDSSWIHYTYYIPEPNVLMFRRLR